MSEFKYQFDDLFNPVLEALHNLGGSGTNQEIEEEVITILGLGQEEINDLHRGSTTKLNYRLRWARNYLKNYGLLENPSRAVWALTPNGLSTRAVEKEEVNRFVIGKNQSTEDKAPSSEKEPMDGVSLYDVSKLLRHSNIRMTEKYAHLAPDYLHKAVAGRGFSAQFQHSGNSLKAVM